MSQLLSQTQREKERPHLLWLLLKEANVKLEILRKDKPLQTLQKQYIQLRDSWAQVLTIVKKRSKECHMKSSKVITIHRE